MENILERITDNEQEKSTTRNANLFQITPFKFFGLAIIVLLIGILIIYLIGRIQALERSLSQVKNQVKENMKNAITRDDLINAIRHYQSKNVTRAPAPPPRTALPKSTTTARIIAPRTALPNNVNNISNGANGTLNNNMSTLGPESMRPATFTTKDIARTGMPHHPHTFHATNRTAPFSVHFANNMTSTIPSNIHSAYPGINNSQYVHSVYPNNNIYVPVNTTARNNKSVYPNTATIAGNVNKGFHGQRVPSNPSSFYPITDQQIANNNYHLYHAERDMSLYDSNISHNVLPNIPMPNAIPNTLSNVPSNPSYSNPVQEEEEEQYNREGMEYEMIPDYTNDGIHNESVQENNFNTVYNETYSTQEDNTLEQFNNQQELIHDTRQEEYIKYHGLPAAIETNNKYTSIDSCDEAVNPIQDDDDNDHVLQEETIYRQEELNHEKFSQIKNVQDNREEEIDTESSHNETIIDNSNGTTKSSTTNADYGDCHDIGNGDNDEDNNMQDNYHARNKNHPNEEHVDSFVDYKRPAEEETLVVLHGGNVIAPLHNTHCKQDKYDDNHKNNHDDNSEKNNHGDGNNNEDKNAFEGNEKHIVYSDDDDDDHANETDYEDKNKAKSEIDIDQQVNDLLVETREIGKQIQSHHQ
jgi:hypothetical protein